MSEPSLLFVLTFAFVSYVLGATSVDGLQMRHVNLARGTPK
jgi:hypothetical protein